jgi:hypothetical protein
MARTAKVTLDETEFSVPALNIGQLERVSAVISAGRGSSGAFEILKIALERAAPKPDFEALAPTLDEVAAAVKAVLVLSGLQKPDENPPRAA